MMVLARKKQSQFKANRRALAGNPKLEARNPTTPVAWLDACCPVSVGKRVKWIPNDRLQQI